MLPSRLPQRSGPPRKLAKHGGVLLTLLSALLLKFLPPLAFLELPNSPSCSLPAFLFLAPSVLLGVVGGATGRCGMPHCGNYDRLEEHGGDGKHYKAGVGHDEVGILSA